MLVRITPPEPVVSLAEAKDHLRVDHDEEDILIFALVEAATTWIDGNDGWLGRALGLQTWELRLSGYLWSHHARYGERVGPWWAYGPAYGWGVRLPLPPLRSVDAVTYRDASRAYQAIDPSTFWVDGVGGSHPGSLSLIGGAAWPTFQTGPDALRIRFTAGYDEVPGPIRQAILLMVGHLYANREQVSTTPQVPTAVPFGVDALLSTYRVFA